MPGVTDVALVADRRRGARPRPSASASTRSARSTSSWNDGTGRRPVRRRRSLARAPGGRAAARRARSVNPLAKTVERDFTFCFRSNSALEPNCAIADVRADGAEIWAGLKSPITAAGARSPTMLGLPPTR